ncbi:hypothetical protein [Acinetobacter bouvetii]|uniref:hypothetical protein n=1 Tax=Acinetobacter bouvetii TaxID=202951 RepID=UPI000361BB36|nr:hypothetical protein [Acinetobacter bouvetii]
MQAPLFAQGLSGFNNLKQNHAEDAFPENHQQASAKCNVYTSDAGFAENMQSAQECMMWRAAAVSAQPAGPCAAGRL